MKLRPVIKPVLAAAVFLILLPEGMCAQNPYGDVWKESLAPARPLYARADTVTMMVIGDIMMHSRQMQYEYGPFLEGVSSRLKAADITVGNMEFTLGGEPYSGYPAFSAPDGYAEYIVSQGVNVFLTANNHILDKGRNGIERTLGIYNDMEASMSIRHTGSASSPEDEQSRYPLLIHRKSISIALVNFTYGTNAGGSGYDWPKVNRMDRKDIGRAIARAKEAEADFIIALPHWGNEYELKHSRQQEDLAKWLAYQGVDAVIGGHPHVVQDSCMIGGTPVFYSVGNAVSNMSAPNTQLELAVRLTFIRNRNGDTYMDEPEVTYLWCSLPGRLRENYTTVAVKDYIGKREIWKNGYDYDKMIKTYTHVKSVTGVTDK